VASVKPHRRRMLAHSAAGVRTSRVVLICALLVGAALLSAPRESSAKITGTAPMSVTAIHVLGNKLVNQSGTPIDLVGLNRSGTEYACAQGWGIFDGPTAPSVISSMKSWFINSVRVPLNEDCWLGINVPAAYSGAIYRLAIERYVHELNTAGLVAILDLHWSAPGNELALGQNLMPDASHSVTFWRSVARAFRIDHDVTFELYNEPHSVSWSCWVSGCEMVGGWRAVGMQRLINTVRQTGATQPILVDGLEWGNDLFGWSKHPLRDPIGQVVAAFHVYRWSGCATARCWSASVGHVAKSVPVITTELGENDCTGAFVTKYLNWSESHGISVLAWTWNDNEGCLSLLKSVASNPSRYGAAVRKDFRRIAQGSFLR